MNLPGRIPLRLKPEFFVVTALLGAGQAQLTSLLIWVGVCLVSVIVHECGHAYVAKAFGYQPSITLWGGGGLTHFARAGEPVPAGRDAWITLAGPGAGFLAGGVSIWLSSVYPAAGNPNLALTYADLRWVNLGWGVVNLLPIVPLDGSHLLRRALERLRPLTATRDAQLASIGVCVLAGGYALLRLHSVFGGLYAAWLAFPSAAALLRARRAARQWAVASEVGAALDAGNTDRALALGEAERARRDDPEPLGFALLRLDRFAEIEPLLKLEAPGRARHPGLEGLFRLIVQQDPGAAQPLLTRQPMPDWLAVEALLALARRSTPALVDTLWQCTFAGLSEGALAALAARAFHAGAYPLSALASQQRFERSGAADAAYNLACIQARLGAVEAGVTWLCRALEAGFSDQALLASDPDLDPLRGHPQFPEQHAMPEAR